MDGFSLHTRKGGYMMRRISRLKAATMTAGFGFQDRGEDAFGEGLFIFGKLTS